MLKQDAIVLIHGLWMHGVVMEPLRHRLQSRHGYTVHNFSYPSVAEGLEKNLEALGSFLAQIDAPSVHLVGHSLGGVLALRALQANPDLRPGRLVCLGSPLTGSVSGRTFATWPGGPTMLGRTLREAVLAGAPTAYTGDREIGVIAGTVGFGMGILLNSLTPPHDGVVTVAETRLPGIRDHMTINLTHWFLVMSRRVADQTAYFLQNGHFDRTMATD